MIEKGADHIVLGCTHYPFLTDVIKGIVGDRMEIVNPAPAIAKRVVEILAQEKLCVSDKGINTFVTTGSNIALVEKMVRDIAPDLANSAIFNTMVI
jgi:glutamate racemase